MSVSVRRRAFLGGLSVLIGLPFLPSLTGGVGIRSSLAAPAVAPKRLLVYYVPNGVYMDAWSPTGTGANYTLSETLQPLSAIRDDVLVLSGLVNAPGVPVVGAGGGAHVCGAGALLTCRPYANNDKINLGKSMDQIIAAEVGKSTKLPSLELGIHDQDDADGPSVLADNISWTGPTTPAPPIEDPLVAFNRLFQGFSQPASDAEAARRRVYRTSVLDVVTNDAKRLNTRLSPSDQHRLDEYMTAIRDVEARIQNAAGLTCTVPGKPAAPVDFPTQVDLNHELITLAFQCDATRVATFMLGYALGGRSYPFIGVTANGHSVTHHSGDSAKIAMVKKIDLWRVQQLVKLVQRLKGIQDVDGNSLLHNTVIYYTSEIGDGDGHTQDNKPVLLCGQLGGTIKTGRHLEFPAGANGRFPPCDETSRTGCSGPQVGDLYLALMQAMGVPGATFGDSGKAPLMNLG